MITSAKIPDMYSQSVDRRPSAEHKLNQTGQFVEEQTVNIVEVLDVDGFNERSNKSLGPNINVARVLCLSVQEDTEYTN